MGQQNSTSKLNLIDCSFVSYSSRNHLAGPCVPRVDSDNMQAANKSYALKMTILARLAETSDPSSFSNNCMQRKPIVSSNTHKNTA